MKRIVLEHRSGEAINASVNPDTREVTFDDKVVTGKMWMISPGRIFVEIIERDGGYYLYTAA